jgi:hypothetical protein
MELPICGEIRVHSLNSLGRSYLTSILICGLMADSMRNFHEIFVKSRHNGALAMPP